MADVVSREIRSRMMSGIRGKNTKPELLLRQALHREGFRFRLHASELPGKPDLVFPRRKAAVFVNGCFWHGHDGCRYFKVPQTRTDFWIDKIDGNRSRDERAKNALLDSGWRVAVVWECATRLNFDPTVAALVDWLLGNAATIETAPARRPSPVVRE